MKKRFNVRKMFAFAAALLIMAVPAAAYATEISVIADSTSVNAGDTVTVTVTVSAEHLAVASGVFTYDPALLTYLSSDGGASDGYINLVSANKGGSSSLTAVIRFKAIGGGDAIINVALENVLDYNEQKLENTDARVSITVAAGASPGTTGGTQETTPPVDISQTGVAAQNVSGTAEQMYIWRSLSSLTLPSGFYDRQVEYGGEFVGGAAIPDNEDLILLYLSEKSGENAGYYIYDNEKDILFPYLTIMSVLKNFTLIWPDDTVEAPEGYEEAVLSWKEKEVPAWTAKGSDGSVYLVYARDSSGEKALYLYNTADESMQRYVTQPVQKPLPSVQPTAVPTDKPVSASEGETSSGSVISIDRTLFTAACIAGAALLAAVFVLAILYAKKSVKKAIISTTEQYYTEAQAAATEADEKKTEVKRAEGKKADDKKHQDRASREKKKVDKKSAKRKAPRSEGQGETVIHVKDVKF